ncbi:MAG: protein tyrosine phosphatase family protein [Acidobacteriota bacterium]
MISLRRIPRAAVLAGLFAAALGGACAHRQAPVPVVAPTPAPPPAPHAALPADLAGVLNASQPEAQLLVSGQPTAAQIAAAGRAGYKTVIDLRAPTEDHGFDEKAASEAAGMVYENLPVSPPSLDAATLDRFIALFRDAPRPVLLHCATANRAGALYYAWLVLEKGVVPDAALRRAEAAGLKHPELVARIQAVVAERQHPR